MGRTGLARLCAISILEGAVCTLNAERALVRIAGKARQAGAWPADGSGVPACHTADAIFHTVAAWRRS